MFGSGYFGQPYFGQGYPGDADEPIVATPDDIVAFTLRIARSVVVLATIAPRGRVVGTVTARRRQVLTLAPRTVAHDLTITQVAP